MTTAANLTQALNGTSDNVTTEPTAGSNKLGKDEFLKLLVTQLQNQDPTNPVDSHTFVAELAQFSSVEQLEAVNDRLDNLLLAEATANSAAATSMTGKEVAFTSNVMTLSTGTPTSAWAVLGASATDVTADIVDSSGRTVRTMKMGARNAGLLDITWDGRTDVGAAAPAGTYTVKVTAKNAAGGTVDVQMQGRGIVTGVSLEGSTPELIVNGAHIKLSDVIEVNERSTP